jgi:nucleoid-associated protein YgaU
VETRLKRAPVILLAAAVVIAGTVAAFQFRKPAELKEAASSWTEGQTPPPTSAATQKSANPAPANSALAGQVENNRASAESSNMQSALAELDRKIFPSQTTVQNQSSPQNTANSHVPLPRESVSSNRQLVSLESEEKTHRIADGDTLAKLAERYLGRADRSVEIFDYNRDVLRTPDVLPIGADLRIPPLVPMQAADPTIHTSAAAGAGQTRLVPVNPPSTAQPQAPPATTPPATSDGKSQKPRTYEVKAGESLVDIARKLYGDGRKHEQLFEANRNVLKNPAALKPGMVLVVP